MPLTAIIDDNLIQSIDFTPDSWRAFKLSEASTHAVMACCNAPAILKTSKNGIPFFAHKKKSDSCESGKESELHLSVKHYLAAFLRDQGLEVYVEYPGETPDGERFISDVFVDMAHPVAIEVQVSNQTYRGYVQRTQKYTKSGVRVLWLAYHNSPDLNGLIDPDMIVFSIDKTSHIVKGPLASVFPGWLEPNYKPGDNQSKSFYKSLNTDSTPHVFDACLDFINEHVDVKQVFDTVGMLTIELPCNKCGIANDYPLALVRSDGEDAFYLEPDRVRTKVFEKKDLIDMGWELIRRRTSRIAQMAARNIPTLAIPGGKKDPYGYIITGGMSLCCRVCQHIPDMESLTTSVNKELSGNVVSIPHTNYGSVFIDAALTLHDILDNSFKYFFFSNPENGPEWEISD